MTFLSDVNIPLSLIKFLRTEHHNVITLDHNQLQVSDIEIISLAQEHQAIILTKDKDFIAHVQYPKYKVPMIVIRCKNQSPRFLIARIKELLQSNLVAQLQHCVTVIYENDARSYPVV